MTVHGMAHVMGTKKPKSEPKSTEKRHLRFRGVWPADFRPIVDATLDCVMRLLCCSVFEGYAAGQVAYRIEGKINGANTRHQARMKPLLDYEQQLSLVGKTLPKDGTGPEWEAWQKLLEEHQKALRVALEGELVEFEPHEFELLKRAVDICHLPDRYVDPSRAIRGQAARWYAPILAVLSGSVTESQAPAPTIPPLPDLASLKKTDAG